MPVAQPPARPPEVLVEVHQAPQNVWVLTGNLAGRNVWRCGEKYIAKKRRQYTSLPQSLSDGVPFIVFTVIRTYAS